MIDAYDAQDLADPLIVDPKRRKRPTTHRLSRSEFLGGPVEGLGREPHNQLEDGNGQSVRGRRVSLGQVCHRRFEIVGGFGGPNDLQRSTRLRTRARTWSC